MLLTIPLKIKFESTLIQMQKVLLSRKMDNLSELYSCLKNIFTNLLCLNGKLYIQNSNTFLPKAELRTNADSAEPGAYRVTGDHPIDGEKEAVLLCFKIFNNDWGLLTQFLIPKDSSYIKVRTCWYKTWENWKKYNADS